MDMNKNTYLIFKNYPLRRKMHNGVWYYVVCDVLKAILEVESPCTHWQKLKRQLEVEGFPDIYLLTLQLEFCENNNTILHECVERYVIWRIIQSIHHPRAEIFKQWFLSLAEEKIEEINNPALAVERARARYFSRGYSSDWIDARIKCINVRSRLLQEWRTRGATEDDFAHLTDRISVETWGVTTSEHKKIKGIPDDSLRDNMTQMELLLSQLGELTTAELHKSNNSQGVIELEKDAVQGGRAASFARRQIETTLGRSVLSSQNAKDFTTQKVLE